MAFNIQIDTASGDILAAGFSDFTAQLQPGTSQVSVPSDDIPAGILTDYRWNAAAGRLERRAAPVPTPAERSLQAARERRRSEYAALPDVPDRIAYLAALLGLV